MNIKINNEDAFKEEVMSMLNNLSDRLSFIEDVILAEDTEEDQIDDSEREMYCRLDNDFTKDLILSMNRLKEYDRQKMEEYCRYLDDDEELLYELESMYDED